MPATPREVRASAGPQTQMPTALTQTATPARSTEGVDPVTPTISTAIPAPIRALARRWA